MFRIILVFSFISLMIGCTNIRWKVGITPKSIPTLTSIDDISIENIKDSELKITMNSEFQYGIDMNKIKEWIRDLINCRKNRITLEEANEKIIKLSSDSKKAIVEIIKKQKENKQ